MDGCPGNAAPDKMLPLGTPPIRMVEHIGRLHAELEAMVLQIRHPEFFVHLTVDNTASPRPVGRQSQLFTPGYQSSFNIPEGA